MDPAPLKTESRFAVSISSHESTEKLTVHLTVFELVALANCCRAMLDHDIVHVASAGSSIDRFEIYAKPT